MVFIEENCMMTLADMMSYLFSQVIMVLFMFFFDWRLGLISLIVTLGMLLLGFAMKKSTLHHSNERQEASEKLTESVLDFTEGIGIIKTFNLMGDKSKELTDSFELNCKVNLDFEFDHVPWQTGVNLIYTVGTVLVLAVSSYFYFSGAMPLNFYIGMLLFLFDLFVPMKLFYGQIARLTVMNSCMDRIESLFAEKELADNGAEMLKDSNAPEIEYRNVTFAYDKKDILKNVSFKSDKGTMTALVGPSGGGKSTIASLLTRFWDVRSGEILLRGMDIRKIPLATLMDNISMVFQRVYLFQDTVYNNIALGRPDASREEIIVAAKKARCYGFIMELPDGFDTVIGEGGASLSGGALALALGIAIQNFPEGAIISMPLHAEGKSKVKAFTGGVLSGAVEPIGALLTILFASQLLPIMPYLLSFAAGAMIYVVVEELIPEMSEGEHSNIGVIMFSVGFTLMMILDAALG